MAAVIDCTVDLAADQKGVHMSRFPELFEEAIEIVVEQRGAPRRGARGAHREQRRRAAGRASGRGGSERSGPSAADAGDRPRDAGDGDAVRDRGGSGPGRAARWASRRTGSTRALARRASCATTRRAALDAGFDRGDVDPDPRAGPDRDAQPARPADALRRNRAGLDAEVLVEIAERSMSAPIYDLLKRPDELFVVEHAHLQPRFVEDSVRHALADALERSRSSTTTTSCSRSRSTSRRSTCTTSSPSASEPSASSGASSRPAGRARADDARRLARA